MKWLWLLIAIPYGIHAMQAEEKIEHDIEVVRARVCYFIEHTPKGCMMHRKNGSKKLKECKHDTYLQQVLVLNEKSSVIYFYQENDERVEQPLILVDCAPATYKKIQEDAIATLNCNRIKPYAYSVQISSEKSPSKQLRMSFYDKNHRWILDHTEPLNATNASLLVTQDLAAIQAVAQTKLADAIDVTRLYANKTAATDRIKGLFLFSVVRVGL